MQQAEKEEYERRQKGSSSPVIPAAIPQQPSAGYNSAGSAGKKDYVAGAVSGTESESESEFVTSLRGNRRKVQFRWTTENEDELEELLIKYQFDFKSAAREFVKTVNKDNKDTFFNVDVKQLQVRWTDIEIRKFRLTES